MNKYKINRFIVLPARWCNCLYNE